MSEKIALKTVYDGVTREITASRGDTLLNALIENRLAPEAACGGTGRCGKCLVFLSGGDNPQSQNNDGKTAVLACRTLIDETFDASRGMTIIIPKRGELNIPTDEKSTRDGNAEPEKAVCGEKFKTKPYPILDIGTTTLELSICVDGEIISSFSAENPQRSYGADVISRIDFCSHGGLSRLHACLTEAVNALLARARDNAPDMDGRFLYVCANTAMLHFFFNRDCSSMGVYPFKCDFLSGRRAKADEIGICGVGECVSLPCVSAYVGADIVSDLYYCGLLLKSGDSSGATVESRSVSHKGKRYTLLADLGTNAELALFSGDDYTVTAAAAGPCFEGANITCGMSARTGAICAVSRGADGKTELSTVNGAAPSGLCATGLTDAVAMLLDERFIDETGTFDGETERFYLAENIYLTQKDIREFSLAKAAVSAGIKTLMKIKNVGFDDINTFFITGGFSYGLNIESAVKTGLIPAELSKKCRFIPKMASLGLAHAVSRDACEALPFLTATDKIANKAVFTDLSTAPGFSDGFIEEILFKTP